MAQSILILPASSYEHGSSNGKKPKTPKKNAVACGTPCTDDVAVSFHDPRNFLVRGGHRAIEQKLMSMNKNAIQELRNANAVLADELVKARTANDQVREQLREKESTVEALQATIERQEKARKLVDKKHLLQLKELNRRYKDEQVHRLALESECAQLRAGKDVIDQQVESLQEERAQLMDLLNGQRSNSSRLEATIAADAATIAELRSRVQAAEERLADEVAARQELFGRHKALEADLKLATERHSCLASSSSEAEGRLRATLSKAQLVEDELEAAKKALQAEKAALSAERQRAAALQSDLTQLQTSSQLAAAAAASDQAELERLRGQSEGLRGANEGLRAEVAKLREEVLHLTAQGVAAQASAQALQHQRDELQQQRDGLQQQLSSTQESMERMERDLRHEAAARVREAREEAAARHRSQAEELTAKLKARERAWEEERATMLRAHEEELARKDHELLEVREHMREAQSSVAELAAEVSTFKFQGEHYAEVFRENEELKKRLARADETISSRDSSLAEAIAAHAAQLELWKAEANEVAQAAAKWKQRCTALQAQLDSKESEAASSEAEARSLTAKLSTSEAERVKLQEMLAGSESRLALATQESNSYRVQLSDVLTSHQSTSRQVETTQQDLQLRDLQLIKLNQSLNEEAARAAQLRQELAAAVAQHAKELDSKRRALDELTDQLRETERARAVTQAEADQLRDKVAVLTRELGRSRVIGGGSSSAAASLRRSADTAADGWGYAQRGGGSGGRGGGGGAFGFEDRAELNRKVYGGRGPPGGRHEYDVASLEEEAESWFKALDDERRRPSRGRPAEQDAGSGDPRAHFHHSHSHSRSHSQPRAASPSEPGNSAGMSGPGGGGVRTYDVTISPKHGASPAAASAGAMEAGGGGSHHQPLPLAPPPYRPAQQPATSGASAGISAGGAAAAIAAAAYTAVVTPLGPRTSAPSSHIAATPQPALAPQPRPAFTGPSPSAVTSGSLYGQQQRQAYGRSYGVSAPLEPHQQQPSAYGYARSDTARSYGAMTPLSPVLSESASNASSNLQERLQRLLGTGKLV